MMRYRVHGTHGNGYGRRDDAPASVIFLRAKQELGLTVEHSAKLRKMDWTNDLRRDTWECRGDGR